jgi:hypothetical protein
MRGMNFILHLHRNASRWPFRWLTMVLALSLAATASSLSAQEKPCATEAVFVNVENHNGGPVVGLTAANFHGLVGKESVSISSAEPAQIKRIVIVSDQSGSMYVADAYTSAASLVANIVAHAPAAYQFALLTYSKNTRVRNPLTTNRNELMNALREAMAVRAPDGPSATSSTLDAAIAGLELLAPSGPGDAVLLVTDGGESSSKASFIDVELRFARSDVRLFAAIPVTTATPNASPEYQTVIAQPLKKMVEAAGGEVFWFAGKPPEVRMDPHHPDLPGGPSGLLEKMTTGYRLQIATPTTVTKTTDLKIELASNSNVNTSGDIPRNQPKLFPCVIPTTQKQIFGVRQPKLFVVPTKKPANSYAHLNRIYSRVRRGEPGI